jgi:hypothetical protein
VTRIRCCLARLLALAAACLVNAHEHAVAQTASLSPERATHAVVERYEDASASITAHFFDPNLRARGLDGQD